jgi:hypothetical protein
MFVPLSDAVAGGLAAAAGERVVLDAALAGPAVGEAAATVCVGVSDRVAVGTAVADGAPVAVGVGAGDAVALGAGEAPLRVAQAFVSCVSTERQADRALVSQGVPSVAVREMDRRMNG